MPEHPDEDGSVRESASAAVSRVVGVLTTLLLVVGVACWSLFWLNIAQLHYSMGDVDSAVFTATVLTVPAILGLLWYLGVSLDAGLPSPSVDVDVLGN